MGSNLALRRPEERLCTTEWAVILIPRLFGLGSGYETGELLSSYPGCLVWGLDMRIVDC